MSVPCVLCGAPAIHAVLRDEHSNVRLLLPTPVVPGTPEAEAAYTLMGTLPFCSFDAECETCRGLVSCGSESVGCTCPAVGMCPECGNPHSDY